MFVFWNFCPDRAHFLGYRNRSLYFPTEPDIFLFLFKQKKEDIWLSPITKAPTPTEKSKKQRDNTKTPPKYRLHNDCGPTLDGQLEEQQQPHWCG